MFNSHPRITRIALGGGQDCLVVDGLLREPQALRRLAKLRRGQFAHDPDNSYPGPELGLPREWAFALDEFFMQHVRKALGARRTISVSARLSMATLAPGALSPLQRLCHRDADTMPPNQGVAASVLYLFEDAGLGGTSFYRPRKPLAQIAAMLREAASGALSPPAAYLTASNDCFEQVASVPAAFNRAIFYDGEIFHAAQIEAPHLLTDDPMTGRLTMNGFFRYRRVAT